MLTIRATFTGHNPRVAPLLDGTVTIPGVEIQWETGDMGEMAARHLHDNQVDLFEFSISDYLNVHERGNSPWDWIAIPVFLSKALLQLNTWVNVNAGVADASDLRGKRLAVGDYTMTAFLWFRTMLRELCSIDSHEIAWYNARVGEHSHSALLGLTENPPPGVAIAFLDRPEAADELLQAGEIDAACATGVPIDTRSLRLRRLFPDHGTSFIEAFYRAVGYVPVNHMVVLQRRLAAEHPWLPVALYDAFEQSRAEAYRRDRTGRAVFREGVSLDWQEETFGSDPYASGIAANRAMLELAIAQSLRDGLIQTGPSVDSLFDASVRGT